MRAVLCAQLCVYLGAAYKKKLLQATCTAAVALRKIHGTKFVSAVLTVQQLLPAAAAAAAALAAAVTVPKSFAAKIFQSGKFQSANSEPTVARSRLPRH